MQVNIHYAKVHLSKLISQVENGEEVIIARNGKPAVKLVAVAPLIRKSRKHMFGSGIGKIWIAEHAFLAETDLDDPA